MPGLSFKIAAALAFLFLPLSAASAATCFWVGGTGNYDNTNTASWASSTGGTTGTCAATGGIPKNANDVATFDAASGGGTVTVCGAASANCPSGSGSLSMAQITMGAFTGTLDFATRNPNVSLTSAFSGTGAGTRTLNLGSGTFTITAGSTTPWNFATTTGLTFNAGSGAIIINTSGNSNTFAGGGLTYNSVTFNVSGTGFGVVLTGANTIATLSAGAGVSFSMPAATTTTVTNAFNLTGTSSAPISFYSSSFASVSTVSTASGTPRCTWCSFHGMTFSGGATFSATNSFNNGLNSGITITGPSAGGGSGIIGG